MEEEGDDDDEEDGQSPGDSARAEAARAEEARRARERMAHEARRRARDTERRELYAVLGVEPGMTRTQLKAAYFAAAKRCHPDTNKSDPAAASKFLRVQQAWQALSREA